MKAFEVLQGARAIIAEGWCQGANARDATGQPVQLMTGNERSRINPLAARFSIYGAICKAGAEGRQEEPGLMWQTLAQLAERSAPIVAGGTNHLHPLLGFNEIEGQTIEAVLAFMDEAIATLKPKEPANETA